MNSLIYRFNKKNKRRFLYNIVLKIIGISLFVFIGFVVYKDIEDSIIVLKLIGGIILFDLVFYFIPLFILYSNHRKHGKGVVFEYDKIHKKYIYSSQDQEIKFTAADLNEVVHFVTPSNYEERTDWVMWGKFFYTHINLKCGRVIKLSCLVLDEVENVFPAEKTIKKKKFFPIITLS
jgi:hypothetical protein